MESDLRVIIFDNPEKCQMTFGEFLWVDLALEQLSRKKD
jgi:hypothetical protein